MKHKIKYKLSASKKTISLELSIPNDDSARLWLHDLVAIRIAAGGQFIGDVYCLKPGKQPKKTGVFTPRFETHEEACQHSR